MFEHFMFELSSKEGAPFFRPAPVGIPVSRPEPNSPAALKAQIAELAKLVEEQAVFIRHRDDTIRALSGDIRSRNRDLDTLEWRVRSLVASGEAHTGRIRTLTGANERLQLEVNVLDWAREVEVKRHAEELKAATSGQGKVAEKLLMQRNLAVRYLHQAWRMVDTVRNALSYGGTTTTEQVVANRKLTLAELTG